MGRLRLFKQPFKIMQMQYFNIEEFNCQETGKNNMCPFFLEKLDQLRHECNMPFHITSGYRDKTHSIEAAKGAPGTHAQGIAVDIQARNGYERYIIASTALRMGFTGIGIAKTFVHVDIRKSVPVLWSY